MHRSRRLAFLLTGLLLTSTVATLSPAVAGQTVPMVAGASWQTPELIDPPAGSLSAVSCPTVTFCMTVDSVGNAFTYDGLSWSQAAPIGPGREPLTAVTCASDTFCAALRDGEVVMYDGHSWTSPMEVAPGVRLLSISCVSGTFCVGGGYTRTESLAIVWDGQTWSDQVRLEETPTAISCATTMFCALVDSRDGAATFDGYSWSPRQDFGAGQLLSVSCVSATFCAASGNGRVLTYDGKRWSRVTKLAGKLVDLVGVSCASAVSCVVAGSSRYSTYRNGRWAPLADIGGKGVTGLACPSTTFCVAVRQQSDVLTFDGTSWTSQGPLEGDRPNALEGVSCPTTTFCLAVDQAGSAFTYDGSSWGSAVPVFNGALQSISCSSRTFCVALTQYKGYALTFDGSGWSRPESIGPHGFGSVLSCASAHFCMVIQSDGSVFTFDGQAWSQATAIVPDQFVLSCSSAMFCLEGGRFHGVSRWDGTSFVADDTFPLAGLNELSCTPAHFCMAFDSPQWATFDGSAWTTGASSHPNSTVSCVSARFCAGVDYLIRASTYDGSGWSRKTTLLTPDQRGDSQSSQVSCATAGFCMAVASSGYAIAYRSAG